MNEHKHEHRVILSCLVVFVILLVLTMSKTFSSDEAFKDGHWECSEYGPEYFKLNCTVPAGAWFMAPDGWAYSYAEDKQLSWDIISEEQFNKTFSQCKETEPKTYQKTKDCIKNVWVKNK